ncbi:MAG TPA: SIMPL domain-containing protein [Bryobacteraceae bacterium]|jgi:hypothetical protein|nr:SIMPL domain-containing protein [Bryobacteraceae bacterium]
MRYLALILLCAFAASAQVADGITTTVNRTVTVTPDEGDFVVVVSTSLDTTQDQVTQSFHDAGIQNLTMTGVAAGLSVPVYQPVNGTTPNPSQLFYQIAFTTTPAALAGYSKKLDAMRASLPSTLTSLQYNAALNASQSAVDTAHQATLPLLLQDARTKAQALATAASLKLGSITGVSESNYGAVGGVSVPYAVISGVLGPFSSSATGSGTQFTFYATVKFGAQ